MKFEIDDEVEVQFIPGSVFKISEIRCYEMPHDKNVKFYNFLITDVGLTKRTFEVSENEIKHNKSFIIIKNRNEKLKKLGI